ncbi:MAG: MFS transporter [Acidobacteriota bacterium]
MRERSWLNRSTIGVSLSSLFSDVSHEMATAVLPAVLTAMGSGPSALGIIEGVADAASAFAKLWGGLLTDRVGRKKPLASIGNLVTALGTASIGLCTVWWQAMICRTTAWVGRGSRGPARDVLMAEAAEPRHHGKAFGMERAADAAGAVIGPLIALAFVWAGCDGRSLVGLSIIPGILSFLSIVVLVQERTPALPAVRRRIWASFAATGRPFHRYLLGIALFGSGDFSRTLLIFYVGRHVVASSAAAIPLSIALYVLHNAVSAAAAFPIGALADRIGRKRVIVAGYLFAAATTLAFALAPPRIPHLAMLFTASGLAIACEEVAEKARAA